MVEDNRLEQLYSDALEKINKNTNDEKKGSRSRSVELFFSFDIVNSSLYKDTNYLGWQSVLTALLTDIQKMLQEKYRRHSYGEFLVMKSSFL